MWLMPHLTYWNGGTKFVFETIKELSKRHQIDLFIQKAGSNEIIKSFNQIPVTVTVLSKLSTGDALFWLNFNRQLKKEISHLKKIASEYDLVISAVFPMNIVGNAIGLPHIQYCFEPYAFFWDPFMVKRFPISKRIFVTLLRYMYGKQDIKATKKSEKILTVNNGTREWIYRVYGRESIATFLGVDTTIFKKIHDEDLMKKYKGKKIIIHSTDWTPLKRTNWLIKQFYEINKKRKDSMLLITEVNTNGEEKNSAISMIKKNRIENIELCGFITNTDLPKYYSLADVSAYTGIGEGASAASLFVLECMACETPVVRTSDTLEEIEHGKTGFLFKKNNEEEFIQYIMKLLNDEEIRRQFGSDARKFIEKQYSWKNVAQVFQKEIVDLLEKKMNPTK